MIQSRKDYIEYLRRDRVALGLPEHRSFFFLLKEFFWPNLTYQFEKRLRLYEYCIIKNSSDALI